MAEIKVKWPNVWTSAGKLFRDDSCDLPDDEAKTLKEIGAVEMKRGRKKEDSDAE